MTPLASSSANNQIFQVTFQGALAGTSQPLMGINHSGMTASANIVLGSVSTTTAGSPAISINTGGTLMLDNTAVNNINRVNDAATVVFNGGTLNYVGGSGVASTETLGSIVFNSGHSTVQSTAGSSGTVAVTAGVVGRTAGATANLVAGGGQTFGTATNQLLINLPAIALLTNGIIKGFTVTDARLREASTWRRRPAAARLRSSP